MMIYDDLYGDIMDYDGIKKMISQFPNQINQFPNM